MQRLPFQDGWALTREPGLPVPVEEDDSSFILFEEPPASPGPSSGDTSVYTITPSIATPGPPTPPPSAGPPIHIDALIRAAAQRLQGAAPVAAVDAAPDAAPDAAHAAVATPPTTPLRRSARLAERARRNEEAAPRPPPRRGPQRVAKMSTGGIRKN